MLSKALLLCKRASPDIQTIVTLLCTRVKKLEKNDWNKSVRIMKYLISIVKGKMISSSARNGVSYIKWYFDAAFVVYPGFKNHTGGTQYLIHGKDAIQSVLK